MNIITALSEGKAKFVPDILVTSSGNGGGALDGLAATAMRFLVGSSASAEPAAAAEKISAKAKAKDAPPSPGLP